MAVKTKMEDKLILWFKETKKTDVSLVGGKNASLGEMYQTLTSKGVKVPNGFSVTAHAYHYFLKATGLDNYITESLKSLQVRNLRNLQSHGKRIRQAIIKATFPPDLDTAIIKAYHQLSPANHLLDVAVRSSATAEDLPDASFAGQQETFLNIRGEKALLLSVKRAFASLFTDRAISYRADKGFPINKAALSVGVQQMVRSDLAVSGVMFTLDTESGFDRAVIISAAYGLGENIVQGTVIPDLYTVFKPTLARSSNSIIDKELGSKERRLVYSNNSAKPTVNKPVPMAERIKYALKDKEILTLAWFGMIIEEHYGRPMDIEWAKDGRDGLLYIVQARPETVHAGRVKKELISYELTKRGTVLASGRSIGEKISTGKARIIKDISGIHSFRAGEILITEMTDPDWEPIMKIASGIITDSGGRTSHAAIVAREMNIPAIVGAKDASQKIKTGAQITVSCAEGETGYIYRGKLPFTIKKTNLQNIPKTKTKVMLILGEPEQAFNHSFLPVEGVGLARLEFIINNSVKIHPLALINYAKLKDAKLKKTIADLTVGYGNKKDYYVDALSRGLGVLAAAFYPNEVIVRFSDFKSNEYSNLIGGKFYEPQEENPMIGWRGASRYYHPDFLPAFALECEAVKHVREEMGLVNLKVMVPFCRTTKEAALVLSTMERFGLKRGVNGLEVYMMVEIPANVILIKEFARYFDGFSIGSNDLTQLTLGLDRDSAIISGIGDERNAAVKEFLHLAIKGAKAVGLPIGICGQAPSDFPELTKFLVSEGISTISVSPDKAIATIMTVSQAEKRRRGR